MGLHILYEMRCKYEAHLNPGLVQVQFPEEETDELNVHSLLSLVDLEYVENVTRKKAPVISSGKSKKKKTQQAE